MIIRLFFVFSLFLFAKMCPILGSDELSYPNSLTSVHSQDSLLRAVEVSSIKENLDSSSSVSTHVYNSDVSGIPPHLVSIAFNHSHANSYASDTAQAPSGIQQEGPQEDDISNAIDIEFNELYLVESFGICALCCCCPCATTELTTRYCLGDYSGVPWYEKLLNVLMPCRLFLY
jgi:hypothetical protein